MLQLLVVAGALALTGPQVGAPAPDFSLTTIGGKPVSLAAFHGKTLVINVWATWCPPCREETSTLIAAAKAAAGPGEVAFLGVDSTEAAPIVRAFVAAKGVPFAQAIDEHDSFAHAFDVRAFPTTFVIDRNGVLRARFVGGITKPILAGFVAAAQAGHDATFVSAAQRQVDALLAPAGFAFSGDPAAIRATAKRVEGTIEKAEAVDGDTDYLRTQAEENALRDAAAVALEPIVASPADTALLAQLQGDAAAARERWPEAFAAYRRGLAAMPDDVDLLTGYAEALRGAEDYAQATDTYARAAELAPSVDAFVSLGSTAGRAGRFNDGAVAFARAIGMARAAYQADPHSATAIKHVAWAYLYEGRLFARQGDDARARAAFAQTAAWAAKLPHSNSRYAMYLEEAQEATVALEARQPNGKTSISLAPWTGPDLPGSATGTFKYRLVVAGAPGKTIALSASGLPKHWIASFCSDRQCEPTRTTVALPSSGVKVIELTLVPLGSPHLEPQVRVDGDGASASLAPSQAYQSIPSPTRI
jgi:thiol-disulfide isomerase/thioredoxin